MSATRLYEGMFLFDSNLASRDWPGLENHVQDLLTRNGAELVYSERWPDRKLSYEIRGCKKGTYYLTYFRAPPDSVPGLRRDTELSERILRLLVLYDKALEQDCEKRLRKEVTGSPEQIEESREKARAAQAQATEDAEKAPRGEPESDDGGGGSGDNGGDEGDGEGQKERRGE